MTHSLGQLTGDLRESAARLETVLASMSDGLLATDHDGLVTSVNRAALEMLGLEEPDVLGEHAVGRRRRARRAAARSWPTPRCGWWTSPPTCSGRTARRVPVRVEISGLLGRRRGRACWCCATPPASARSSG